MASWSLIILSKIPVTCTIRCWEPLLSCSPSEQAWIMASKASSSSPDTSAKGEVDMRAKSSISALSEISEAWPGSRSDSRDTQISENTLELRWMWLGLALAGFASFSRMLVTIEFDSRTWLLLRTSLSFNWHKGMLKWLMRLRSFGKGFSGSACHKLSTCTLINEDGLLTWMVRRWIENVVDHLHHSAMQRSYSKGLAERVWAHRVLLQKTLDDRLDSRIFHQSSSSFTDSCFVTWTCRNCSSKQWDGQIWGFFDDLDLLIMKAIFFLNNCQHRAKEVTFSNHLRILRMEEGQGLLLSATPAHPDRIHYPKPKQLKG